MFLHGPTDLQQVKKLATPLECSDQFPKAPTEFGKLSCDTLMCYPEYTGG